MSSPLAMRVRLWETARMLRKKISESRVSAFLSPNPSLTTVRRPLRKMGQIAVETLLQRIANPKKIRYAKTIDVEPELIMRESTGRLRR